MDKILKPREIEEDGHLWIQHVSSSPATTADVLNLQEQMDQKLVQLQALETGICPIRRKLYDQCFDELIRQVTINCAERGLLLLRVRDEFRMTLEACEALYESSVAFGVRKKLKAKQNKLYIETEIKKIKNEIEDLKQQIAELTSKCEMTEQNTREQNEEVEQKFTEEIQILKRSNQQLKTKLEEIITSRK